LLLGLASGAIVLLVVYLLGATLWTAAIIGASIAVSAARGVPARSQRADAVARDELDLKIAAGPINARVD